jgi:hypothetical protein
MSGTFPPLPTVGEIARRLGQPVHRIEYVIRSRRLMPAGPAGNCRVLTEKDLARIDATLRDIHSRREGNP